MTFTRFIFQKNCKQNFFHLFLLGIVFAVFFQNSISLGQPLLPVPASGSNMSSYSLSLTPLGLDNRNSDCEEASSKNDNLRKKIIAFAKRQLGRPYKNSGKSPSKGFDCSGFTGFIFRQFGFRLKASSSAQAMEGRIVPVCEAKTGDLAFFGRKNRNGKFRVNHAAIVVSLPGEPLSIIHSASGKGIVITKVNESRYWKRALLFVRQVL